MKDETKPWFIFCVAFVLALAVLTIQRLDRIAAALEAVRP